LERITVDVADSQAVERALGATAARRPAPDLVIHSAGIQLAKPFSDLTADEFRRVIEVNLIGSRNIAAAVLPRLQAGARFAFVASLAGTLNVETAAREILAGLARGQFLLIPGGRVKLTPALDRLVPRSMSHRIADIVVSSALRDAEHD
jgi:NAD(P)-dependent dehydrogenase (short-subunit alcohol dehydrogenase family)